MIHAIVIWRWCNWDKTAINLTTGLAVAALQVSSRAVPARSHPSARAGIRCRGAFCVGTRRLWTFSRHLRRVLALRPFFFLATEGKQMRRNVNSRLLTQHCAGEKKKKKKKSALAAFARYLLSILSACWTDRLTVSLLHGGQIKRPGVQPSTPLQSTSLPNVLLSEHSDVRRPRFYCSASARDQAGEAAAQCRTAPRCTALPRPTFPREVPSIKKGRKGDFQGAKLSGFKEFFPLSFFLPHPG